MTFDTESFSNAVQYNATTRNFTNLANWPCSDQFGDFLLELYQRKKLLDRNWHEDYFAYDRWRLLRTAVHTTSLTSWIGDWVPQLRKEYRYTWNDNLDEAIVITAGKTLTWTQWLKSMFLWQTSEGERVLEQHNHAPGRLPLNTANFIDAFALAIESLKAQAFEAHGINITSAVIAKPSYIYNRLENLIDRACVKADLEILDKKWRAEAARHIPSMAGKKEILVLEQWGYDFVLSTESSSMGRHDLSASWIPVHLMSEMLQSIGPMDNATTESLNAATRRLAVEIVRARWNMKFSCMDDPDLSKEDDMPIIVSNFGSDGFTFEGSLSGSNILRVEEEYSAQVQSAIETMLLKHDEIHKYQKDNDLHEERINEEALMDFAKSFPHPEAASGGSWWKSIDAMLVLADFPDAGLIQRAAMKAVAGITSKKYDKVIEEEYMKYNIVARGAALQASEWIGYWEAEERSRRCSSEEDFDKCWDAEWEEEQGTNEQVMHEEL
jgi:hypothetical protein